MAVAKSARVVDSRSIGEDTRMLELVAAEPLGFVGGQYIIVDTKLALPSGKLVKRAYSLLASDADQTRFALLVKRIPEGLASGYLHDVEVGAEIAFSGPWGKLFPNEGATGATLVLATDTGITAALGLVQSTRFAPLLDATTLVWLRTSPTYFVAEEFVRARIPAACREVRIEILPPIGHPERIPHTRSLVRDRLPGLVRAFVAGDGAVNYALLDDLVAAGIAATRDSVESFFNMPKKSA